MTRISAALALLFALGCSGEGVRVYPPVPADPADTWPAGSTGPDCRESSPLSCRDLKVGTGEPVQAFSQVSVRVTVEDTKPAATRGPVLVTFVYPAIEKIPFRGREWDITTTILDEGADAGPFFARSEAAMIGFNVVGMRMGGIRRVTESYAGKLGTLDLPPGQPRHYTLALVQVCYPQMFVKSRLHWSLMDGSGSPVRLHPRLTITGCGN